MKKSSEYFKISFFVGFCSVFITSQLFADAHEKLQIPRVHVNPSETQSLEEVSVSHTDDEESVPLPSFHKTPTSMVEVLEMYDRAERAAKGLKSPACTEMEQSHTRNGSTQSTTNHTRLRVSDNEVSVSRDYSNDTKFTIEQLDNILLTEKKMQMFFGNNGGNKNIASKNDQKKWKNAIEKLREANISILRFLESQEQKQKSVIDAVRLKKLIDSNLSTYAQNRKLIFDYKVHPDVVQSYNKLDQIYMKLLWQKVAKEIPDKKEKSKREYETEVKFIKKLSQSDPSLIGEFKKSLDSKIAGLKASMKTDAEIFTIKKQHKDSDDALRDAERRSKSTKNMQSKVKTSTAKDIDVTKMTEKRNDLQRQLNQHDDVLKEVKEITTIQTFIEQVEKKKWWKF